MKVYKKFLNNLKEEAWIRSLANDGWLIEKIGFGYTFKKVEKKKYNLKMDYRIFSKQEEFESYTRLYEDFGWQHIAGDKTSGAHYFISGNTKPQTEMFSDEDSQRARIIRIRKMLRQTITIALVFFIILLSQNNITLSTLLNPKGLYLTPGLWEMSGSTFASAFWSETPLALFRGILMYALPIVIMIYVVFAYKVQHDYNKSLKKLK